ncbi:hypothetical protein J1C67_14470 [Clostridium gasigenes]|uniref:hypothetical protein n=1 Tax=Clostridium gasigenes TaxID=94869 RepID=UPI00143850FB|nr:hypothetical protein [Clostridium gasigenes]NKF05287.1 hypothetical protein [Clostridium gasigenes]QSW18742.1 hypothetical protein J1C67_14470 [Clostridium gasigenes]
MCKDKICTIKGCESKIKARGLCSTHYKQLLRNGRVQDVIDTDITVMDLAVKAIKNSGAYTADTMKEFMAKKVSIKIIDIAGKSEIVIKSNPMSFFNQKTLEYSIFSGDQGMNKSIQGFRITDLVEKKYQLAAFTLSEAINENNEIVCTTGIAIGETLTGMPPASELQMARMLGYADNGKRYKECIKSLLKSGIIYKFTMKEDMPGMINSVFFFNPIFQNNGKGISPRLFFFFYSSFDLMAKQNKAFQFRFEQMANFSLSWIVNKRADFKELLSKRAELGEIKTAEMATKIVSEVANSYGINVDLIAEIESDDMDEISLIEMKLNPALSYTNLEYGITEEAIMNEDVLESAMEDVFPVTVEVNTSRKSMSEIMKERMESNKDKPKIKVGPRPSKLPTRYVDSNNNLYGNESESTYM